MRCRHCKAELSLQMVDLGAAPPSNAFHTTQNEPEQHYPLRVLVCTECWLAQTDISLFKLDYDGLFTKDYPYFSSTSRGWLAHAKDYAGMAARRFKLGADTLTVEVGSNDGYLLQFFDSPCYGFEPTETRKAAEKKGITSYGEFFTSDKAATAAKLRGHADLIVCNNVLAHVPDINDFVSGFSVLLKPHGVATFEFPHLLRLVRGHQFDTIYHEHYSYLSLLAVERIFRANGLNVFDVEQLPTHGGSLRVYAQRTEGGKPETPAVRALLAEEKASGMLQASFYQGMQRNADCIKNELMSFLIKAKSIGRSVAGFGAAAKGNTLLNYAGVRSDLIRYVVDETPAKQGKFLPGSRIPVLDDFADKPDYVIVFPWNFRAEITEKLRYIRDWGGRLVFAVPRLEVL